MENTHVCNATCVFQKNATIIILTYKNFVIDKNKMIKKYCDLVKKGDDRINDLKAEME